MSYSNEVKQSVLLRVSQGEKVKNISKDTGISIATIYLWKKQANNIKARDEKKDIEEKNNNKFFEKIKITDNQLKNLLGRIILCM